MLMIFLYSFSWDMYKYNHFCPVCEVNLSKFDPDSVVLSRPVTSNIERPLTSSSMKRPLTSNPEEKYRPTLIKLKSKKKKPGKKKRGKKYQVEGPFTLDNILKMKRFFLCKWALCLCFRCQSTDLLFRIRRAPKRDEKTDLTRYQKSMLKNE